MHHILYIYMQMHQRIHACTWGTAHEYTCITRIHMHHPHANEHAAYACTLITHIIIHIHTSHISYRISYNICMHMWFIYATFTHMQPCMQPQVSQACKHMHHIHALNISTCVSCMRCARIVPSSCLCVHIRTSHYMHAHERPSHQCMHMHRMHAHKNASHACTSSRVDTNHMHVDRTHTSRAWHRYMHVHTYIYLMYACTQFKRIYARMWCMHINACVCMHVVTVH